MAAKSNTERRHYIRRVMERYNLLLSQWEYEYLISKIKKNDKTVVTFLTKQTNRLTVHILLYKDKEIVSVYDRMRKELVTALPDICKDIKNINFYNPELDEL